MLMIWKGFGRKRSWPILRYYPGIRLDGLRKPTKKTIRIAGSRIRFFNPRPPEYEAGVLMLSVSPGICQRVLLDESLELRKERTIDQKVVGVHGTLCTIPPRKSSQKSE
jgi:hypothetical protein